jgi:hypothetical protein
MRTKNVVVICITLLIGGIVFWPTLYRYDKMTIRGNSLQVRVNRLTGYTEYFALGKWVPEKGHENKREGTSIPLEERLKITGNAALRYGTFSGKIYNGSSWTISKVTFRVKAVETYGTTRWERQFNESIQIDPLTTSYFNITVTGDEGIGSFSWQIDEVLGFKTGE